MELIKIDTDHFVVVDDSEIREGDWMIRNGEQPILVTPNFWWDFGVRYKKITHSTNIDWNDVYYIPLQEVKELIGEVDVEKKAEEKYPKSEFWVGSSPSRLYDENAKERRCFIEGYNQALEDNKEKKYTEEDLKYMFDCGRNYQNNAEITFKVSFEYLLQTKTSWQVEFVDGKLKLK